jgi:hypothetical protein
MVLSTAFILYKTYRPQIIPTLTDPAITQDAILDTIAECLKKISDSSKHQHLNSTSSDDNKKNPTSGWDKVLDVIQKMILKISLVNDSSFVPRPCDTYVQILKQNKSIRAAMIINILLSTMGCQVEVPMSMANAIKTGNFRANSLQVAHLFFYF